jgi:hypothetical protein
MLFEEFNWFRKKKDAPFPDIDPLGEENWDDVNVLNVIRERYPDMPFEDIKECNISYAKLQDLNGIQALVNLESLNCSHNMLTNIEILQELKHLIILNVSHNQLENLNYLVGDKLQIVIANNNHMSKEVKNMYKMHFNFRRYRKPGYKFVF